MKLTAIEIRLLLELLDDDVRALSLDDEDTTVHEAIEIKLREELKS